MVHNPNLESFTYHKAVFFLLEIKIISQDANIRPYKNVFGYRGKFYQIDMDSCFGSGVISSIWVFFRYRRLIKLRFALPFHINSPCAKRVQIRVKITKVGWRLRFVQTPVRYKQQLLPSLGRQTLFALIDIWWRAIGIGLSTKPHFQTLCRHFRRTW